MIKIKENILLGDFSTFKIGGIARFFVSVKTKKELVEALRWAKENKQKYFILGGGSNILFVKNFDGLVIKNEMSVFVVKGETIIVGSGNNLTRSIEKSLEYGLIGMEIMYWIPGTLGGAIRGNAGAYGGQISNIIESVCFLDENLEEKIFKKEECGFEYRNSIFKQNQNLIILSVSLNLNRGNVKDAKNKIKEILDKRKSNEPEEASAGCIFKNIKDDEFGNFIKNNKDIKIPNIFLERRAIPTGWLIEMIGLKGESIGGAEISKKHANFIINKGNATASDVLRLTDLIKSIVKEKFKVNLETEIQIVGE